MNDVVHILDAACDADAALEAALLAGADGPVACLGPPPAIEGRRAARIKSVGLDCRYGLGRELRRRLAGGAVAHCGSAGAARGVLDAVGEAAPLAVRCTSALQPDDLAALTVGRNGPETLALVCAAPSAAEAVGSAGLAVRVIPPAVLPVPDGKDARAAAREALGISPEEIAIAAPGPAGRRSGHRLAVWATAILAEAGYPVRLVIEPTRAARDAAHFGREAGFGRQIVLPGGAALADILAAADAALLLAADALPPVTAAAVLSAGLPLVAGDVAGADWLEDGRNALLVAHDEPRAIAQGMMKLIEDESLRSRLKRSARARARKAFEAARSADEWRRLYAELSEAARAPSPG